MATFITGSSGYIGSYVLAHFLRETEDHAILLIRAKNQEEASEKLWKALQLHMTFEEFYEHLQTRIDFLLGDLTAPYFGVTKSYYDKFVHKLDSAIHIAASLNRKSEKACLNVNLRGTLEVLQFVRRAHEHHGVRRFSDVSTVAVAGHRENDVVSEDESVDWNRSDYDPYARTKKFCEHMTHELLTDVPHIIFRPSVVLGDSSRPETTQFDMVRAFVFLAKLPVIPLRPNWKIDIVPADYVGKAIFKIHHKDKPRYSIYHLSSGVESLTYQEIVSALESSGLNRKHRFMPWLLGPFQWSVHRLMNTPRSWGISPSASLLKVFLPYLTYNTVFDNARVEEEIDEVPQPFSSYAYSLLSFAEKNRFSYPYLPWPQSHEKVKKAS